MTHFLICEVDIFLETYCQKWSTSQIKKCVIDISDHWDKSQRGTSPMPSVILISQRTCVPGLINIFLHYPIDDISY
jgi:hypothetical protein